MTEGMEVLSAGAPGVKTPVLRNPRNVGILLLEFGSVRRTGCPGPVSNFVKRYLSTGCEKLSEFGSLRISVRRRSAAGARETGPRHRTLALEYSFCRSLGVSMPSKTFMVRASGS